MIICCYLSEQEIAALSACVTIATETEDETNEVATRAREAILMIEAFKRIEERRTTKVE